MKILILHLQIAIHTASNLLHRIIQSLKYGGRIHHIIWATNKLVKIIPHAAHVVQEISGCYTTSGFITASTSTKVPKQFQSSTHLQDLVTKIHFNIILQSKKQPPATRFSNLNYEFMFCLPSNTIKNSQEPPRRPMFLFRTFDNPICVRSSTTITTISYLRIKCFVHCRK
jgi:hypothetical protein